MLTTTTKYAAQSHPCHVTKRRSSHYYPLPTAYQQDRSHAPVFFFRPSLHFTLLHRRVSAASFIIPIQFIDQRYKHHPDPSTAPPLPVNTTNHYSITASGLLNNSPSLSPFSPVLWVRPCVIPPLRNTPFGFGLSVTPFNEASPVATLSVV